MISLEYCVWVVLRVKTEKHRRACKRWWDSKKVKPPELTSEQLTLFFAWRLLQIIAKRKRHKEQNRRYKEKFPERVLKSRKDSKVKNPKRNRTEYHTLYCKERYANDPEYRLVVNYRTRLNNALNGNWKSGSTINLLGCSAAECLDYLEKKFKEGMTRENHGEWHVDHIRPCADFDLTDPAQQKICFHYTNLQPLWAEDNLKKGDRVPVI